MRRTVMKQALQPSEIASINADDFKGARSFEKKKKSPVSSPLPEDLLLFKVTDSLSQIL